MFQSSLLFSLKNVLIDHVIENTFSCNILRTDECVVKKQNKTKNVVVLQEKGGILEIVQDITEVSVGEEKVHIVYVIESALYGVICTSCLCQKPERARYERVRAFDTNNECI